MPAGQDGEPSLGGAAPSRVGQQLTGRIPLGAGEAAGSCAGSMLAPRAVARQEVPGAMRAATGEAAAERRVPASGAEVR
eukprot:1884661-Pleurochrysis_carterae.AAC.2